MKNLLFSNVKNFRYEHKFYITELTLKEIEIKIKFHPAIFQEIYRGRAVNNIYFDSFNFHNFYDNIEGITQRLKVRIRWYGNMFGAIEQPVLEFKFKHNLHVGKLSYPLKPFILDDNFSIDTIRAIFAASDLSQPLKAYLKELNFSLLNSYYRKYFLSADHKYRITVDDHMQVRALSPYRNTFLHTLTDYNGIVLELKYNKQPYNTGADKITNYFSFRVTKSSKYVEGVKKIMVK